MKTVQFSEAEVKRLVAILADQWSRHATYAAMDSTVRTWNAPYGRHDPRKWIAGHASDARALSKILYSLGVETPKVDASSYVTPIGDWLIKNAGGRTGDMTFRSALWMKTRDALEKAITG